MRRAGALLFVLLSFAAGFSARAARAEEPVAVTVSAGSFGVLDKHEVYETGWEVRFAPHRFRWIPRFLQKTSPTLGAMANSQGDLYAYGGFRYDRPLSRNWSLSPQWSAGLYYQDGGRNLGGVIEFRSGIELSRRLGERSRLGVSFFHISNAAIYNFNPGSESLVLTYTARP